ncbi:MAG: Ig-like domain-containing protein [Planctomycetes bacterium]|nr:Ig-like domain-containing protein [Planctomycetota bacterium]
MNRFVSSVAVPLGLVGATLLGLTACKGGSKGDPDNRGDFKVTLVSTGQGQIYPYRIRALDSQGSPTNQIVNIESLSVLAANTNSVNGVLPVATFPDSAVLPDGRAGNQYLHLRFSHKLEIESILSRALSNASTNSGLTTAISVLSYEPNTEQSLTLRGRGFVGGYTFVNRGGVLELVQAVRENGGAIEVLDPVGAGFPRGFSNDLELVLPHSFVFVADSDGDLDTFETFDPFNEGRLIRLRVTNAVRDSEGDFLEQELCTATSVGDDTNPPQVLGYSRLPQIVPGNGATGVDPTTSIRVAFNKPVQPADVGTYFNAANPTPQPGGLALNVTIGSRSFSVQYYADPVSFANFCEFDIRPAYNLPGSTNVEVAVTASSIHALFGPQLGQNIATNFTTGEGPGIVNAPVAPDALYVGIGGSEPGVACIDLNGFGKGTNGLDPDPITGIPRRSAQETNLPRNPNLGQPGVVPPLSVGTGTLDAGSDGPLSLVTDTRGNIRLLRAPIVGQVTDVHIGPPLDIVYNNSNINVNAGGQNQVNPVTQAGATGNTISVSPHPNPPPLVFPPPNLSRQIFGEEPTVTTSGQPPRPVVITTVPPCITSPVNLLVSGTIRDYPAHFAEGVYYGPQPAPAAPPPPPRNCPFTSRQQIGHFLYVLDRENRQVLVLNSNRFTVLQTIRLSDPVAMTMSPSLGVLAVANFSSSSVSFINIDPRSARFNTVTSEARVPDGPTKIAWQPDGESVIVISQGSNSLTVIGGADFKVKNTVTGSLNSPIDIAVTCRQVTTGNLSGVYYAYVLNETGSIAVYESGPSGVNGIGFDDMIGNADPVFRRATRVKLDYFSAQTGVYVAHVDDAGVGVVSRMELTASPRGPLPTQQNNGGFILPPTFRQKVWTITQRFGGSDPTVPGNQRLTGNSPIDVSTDEIFNSGALPNQTTNFSGTLGQSFLGHSSKGALVITPNGTAALPFQPRYLFVALGDVAAVDVFDLATRARVRTLSIPGVKSLSGYWKQ